MADTNFEKTNVASWVEILSGGPPKDGIPALDAPTFHTVAQEGLLTPREPVITVEIEGEKPRAYLIRYLTWHEIVNDTIGDIPVAVTFCPFLYSGEVPPHDILALARVVRVGDAAWPLTRLAEEGKVTEDGVTLSWTAGQASALNTACIADRRDVGNVRVRDAAGNDLAHDMMFAFAFHAFWPDGDWKLGGS